ncbi:putative transcriptional regulator [Lachnospiraceae bacterium JC7]|nr:putative transcriptional regulator [Lachnospiraceae bacterium JC7]
MRKSKNIDLTTVGGRIKFLREQADMTQDELAEELGLNDRSSISSYETNRRDISAFQAVCIAKILNSTTDYILLGDERGSFEEELMRLAGKVRTHAVKNMILKQVRDAIEMEELLIKNTH